MRPRRDDPEPGGRFAHADFLEADLDAEPDDMVLCLEVLEHQEAPGRLLGRLAARPRMGAAISVPWEPWFRLGNLCRGKNLARLGNDPGHVQRFGRRRFRSLVAEHFPDPEVRASFPWLIAFAGPVTPPPRPPPPAASS